MHPGKEQAKLHRRTFMAAAGAALMAPWGKAAAAAGPVHGSVANGYEGVRTAFAEAMAGDPGGGQLCVYRKGRRIVDLWTGIDPFGDRPFAADSLSILMSCSKGVTATCAHMLVERGQLDLAAPVAKYWPEFAANGKAGIPVAWLLSHKAGLSAFPPEAHIDQSQWVDWDLCTRTLAAMKPMWEPGTAFMYHAFTFGWLVGEVIRRVTGKMPGQFVAEEISGPLKLDLYLGLPEMLEPRVVPEFAPGKKPVGLMNTRAGHAAQIPAANMIGNARGLAKMYAALLGPVDGVRLLKAETVERARTPQTDGFTWPLPYQDSKEFPQRWAMGYEPSRGGSPKLGPTSFGHNGGGGRLGFADPASGTAAAFVCNCISWAGSATGPDPRWMPWTAALRSAIARASD